MCEEPARAQPNRHEPLGSPIMDRGDDESDERDCRADENDDRSGGLHEVAYRSTGAGKGFPPYSLILGRSPVLPALAATFARTGARVPA